MNELLRMRYLDAVGIDVFVPRYELPAALVSVPCLLPEVVAGDQAPPVVVAKGLERSGGPLVSVEALLTHAVPLPKTASETLDVAVAAEVALATPEKVRFSLAVWRVSEALLAVDSREVGAALPTDALLANIVCACGVSSGSPVIDNLAWPLVDVPGKPQGWSEARDMVATYLEGKLAKPVVFMLLFGKDAYSAIAGRDDYVETLWRSTTVEAFGCEALVFPSLADLLRDPKSKRRLWECLCACGVVQPGVE